MIILAKYQLPCQVANSLNTTNCLDLPSDNNMKNISPATSNHGKKAIILVDNNNKNIKQADIN